MINKYSNVPLYSQLKSIIIKKIDTGEYEGDSKIPSEQELCAIYDISRPTVRQAVTELTNNGILYKKKGKGTFVAKCKTTIDVRDYTGFTDSILDSLNPGHRNIISLEIDDKSSCCDLNNFFINTNEFAKVTYLSTQENDILALNISYIPLNLFPDIIESIKEKKPSYDIMRGRYPLLPVKTKSSLDIVFTDQSEAHYLKIQTGQPLIRIKNVLYSKSGQVVEFIISKYRSDNCMLTFESAK